MGMTYEDEEAPFPSPFDPRFALVGYVYGGEIYCVGCLPPVEGCECDLDATDERSNCMSNCSGEGPHQVFRGELAAKKGCSSCGATLKEAT
jgi:hypothetical protein